MDCVINDWILISNCNTDYYWLKFNKCSYPKSINKIEGNLSLKISRNIENAFVIWASTVLTEIDKCIAISSFVSPSFLLKIKISLHFVGSLSISFLMAWTAVS